MTISLSEIESRMLAGGSEPTRQDALALLHLVSELRRENESLHKKVQQLAHNQRAWYE